jgi:hypothetical protein
LGGLVGQKKSPMPFFGFAALAQASSSVTRSWWMADTPYAE